MHDDNDRLDPEPLRQQRARSCAGPAARATPVCDLWPGSPPG